MSSLDLFTQFFNGVTLSSPVAVTTYGQVGGMVDLSRSGDSFYHFKSIPFAKPPIGDLRFRAPQPPDKWKGVKQVKTIPMFCIQMLTVMIPTIRRMMPPVGKEDCLYLSVSTRSLSPKTKRPVLVYLHGGAYMGLAGPSFWTPTFLMDSDLVVVMVNYRLNMLGFMSFEDEVVPGNMGLKDQNLALQWVRDNIKNFGGDPNRVTIMGESAGAASVHYHTLSPMSQGLFHQIIPFSGTAYAAWAYAYPGDARIQAFQYAKYVGCRGDNSTVVVSCMKKLSANKLLRATAQFFEWIPQSPGDFKVQHWSVNVQSDCRSEMRRILDAWDLEPLRNIGPVFEKKRPWAFTPSSTKKWKPVAVPMLIGETDGEGLLKTILYKSRLRPKNWRWVSNNWDEVMAFSLRFLFNPRHKEITQNIKNYWFGARDELQETDLTNFTNLYSTVGLLSPILHMAEMSKAKVYYFKFNYLGEISPSTLIDDANFPKTTFHSESLIYVMRSIFLPALRGNDLEVSRNFTRMIANFVIHGDPTPETGLWKPWTNTTYDSILIDNNGTRMVSEGLPEDIRFWRSQCAYERFFGCTV